MAMWLVLSIWISGGKLNISFLNPFNNTTKDKIGISETDKKKEITLLGIMLGCGIAFIFRASFLTLFQSPGTNKNIFGVWEKPLIEDWTFNEYYVFSWAAFIGIVITGFFLSFGSQFFHDLLDLVLEAKNARRKLNDPQTYEAQSVKGLDEYRQMIATQEANLAIEQNDYLLKLPNVISALPGIKINNGVKEHCVEIHLSDDDTSRVPSSLPFKLSDGQVIKVLANVIPNVSIPKVHFNPGDSLKPEDSTTIGTFGLVVNKVKDAGQKYLLTCSHVMNDGSSIAEQGEVFDSQAVNVVETNNPQQIIGTHHYELCTNRYDIALIKLTLDLTNRITNTKTLNKEYYLPNSTDESNRTRVVMRGGSSGRKTGVIKNVGVDYEIDYDGTTIKAKDLIVISKWSTAKGWQTLSKSGDSGGIVYTTDLKPIGIVIAGNDHFTFVQPIDRILEKTDTEIA